MRSRMERSRRYRSETKIGGREEIRTPDPLLANLHHELARLALPISMYTIFDGVWQALFP